MPLNPTTYDLLIQPKTDFESDVRKLLHFDSQDFDTQEQGTQNVGGGEPADYKSTLPGPAEKIPYHQPLELSGAGTTRAAMVLIPLRITTSMDPTGWKRSS